MSDKTKKPPIGNISLAVIPKRAEYTHIEDKDRLELMLAAERARNGQSMLTSAENALTAARLELQARLDAESRLLIPARQKYNLKDGDTYDLVDGKISRK